MHSRATDGIHHRMATLDSRIIRRRTNRRRFTRRLLHRLGPVTRTIAQFIRREIPWAEPTAGLDTNHLQAGVG